MAGKNEFMHASPWCIFGHFLFLFCSKAERKMWIFTPPFLACAVIIILETQRRREKPPYATECKPLTPRDILNFSLQIALHMFNVIILDPLQHLTKKCARRSISGKPVFTNTFERTFRVCTCRIEIAINGGIETFILIWLCEKMWHTKKAQVKKMEQALLSSIPSSPVIWKHFYKDVLPDIPPALSVTTDTKLMVPIDAEAVNFIG